MRRRADDVTRIDEARCAAHANAGNLKRQLEQRCNDDAERLPGFRGEIQFSPAVAARPVRDDLRRTRALYVPPESGPYCGPTAIYRCRSRPRNANLSSDDSGAGGGGGALAIKREIASLDCAVTRDVMRPR